ncbi:MAG: RNA-binding domain-containing protein [Vampirovibrionia bacterium]
MPEATEFKRELNDKLEKTVISFLNSKTGGDIFIGVGEVKHLFTLWFLVVLKNLIT